MNRWKVGLLALLAACGSETGFRTPLPHWPDTFPAPLPDTTQEDVILQVTIPIVDVLFVIDNSCSMDDEQSALAASFPGFIGYFVGSGLEWHVGVTSTDLDNPFHQGKLREAQGYLYLDENTDQPHDVFTEMASMGTGGTGTEKGLGATYLALGREPDGWRDSYNAGFYRDDASITTIVISDEGDQTPDTLVDRGEFVDWYNALKPTSGERTFSGVLRPENSTKYIKTVEDIGGSWWDIGTSNWDNVLDNLGVQASGLKSEFFLSHLPVLGTIEVDLVYPDGYVIPHGSDDFPQWHYCADPDQEWPPRDTDEECVPDGRNSIKFYDYIPESLTQVVIRYTVLSSSENTQPVENPPE